MATIKGITVQIGADTTGLDAALKDVNRTSREISKELREVERLLKFNPHDTEVLAQKQKLLADQVENTREKLNRLREVQAQVNQQFQEGKISEEQYRAFQRELIKTESQLKEYEKQLRAVNLQNHEFNQKMQEAGEKLQDVGKKLTDVGKTLSTRLTAPLVAFGGIAAKSAIDFESAFAGVRKTVDATEEEFAALERGIRDMAKEIPAAATEIAGVAEAAGQLGIQNEHILSFTRTMIDLGEATNMSAEEAATALARLANITQMPQSEFDRLGSTIVALGNNLATTEAEIVEMGLRLAGAGSQVGMTEAEILSLAGALSSVGIEAQAGGSAFSKVMVNMQLAAETGGEKLEQFAAVAGMSAEQFATTFQENAAQALIAFINGLQRAEEQGISAIKVLDDMGITEVRMRDALLRAAGAGDLFTEAIQLGTQAWEENTALTNEAAQRYETTASKLEIMRNQLQDVAITFGEILLPPLLTVVEKVGEFAGWLAGLDPKLKTTIVVVGGLVAALGPVLIVVGQIVSSIGTLMPLLGTLAAFIKTTLIPAIMGISAPAIGTVAAIAALGVVAYEVYRNWTEVKNALVSLWELIKASAVQLGLNVALAFEQMKHAVLGAVNAILERLSVLEKLPFGIGDKFAGLKDSISDSVDGSAKKIAELEQRLADNAVRITEAVEGTKVAFSDLGAAVANDVKAVVAALTGQTAAVAAEMDEQTSTIEDERAQQLRVITETQREMTQTVEREGAARVEATQQSEEEQTEIMSTEARKRAEARAEFEAEWNRKLFQLTADRLAQLEAEEAEALARAEALEADKTAILEYYSIKRQEILNEENEQRREAEQRRLDALAKFEEDWARKLFEATADRLEILEREKQEALARAEELGADKTAIIEYYALRQQEILDQQLREDEERDQRRLQSIAEFEEAWARKLFEQSASRLELLQRERDEAIRQAEELGADTTAILEYYALQQQRILDEQAKATREAAEREAQALAAFEEAWTRKLFEQSASRLERLQRDRDEALAEAERLGADTTAILAYYAEEERRIHAETEAEKERLAQQWRDRLFELQADELEKLEAQMQAELELAERYQLDATAILEYYEERRQQILRRRREEAEAQAQQEARAAQELAERKAQFEESWTRKLFEQSASRIERLRRERDEALAEAERLGADRTAILEYYAEEERRIEEETAAERERRTAEQLETLKRFQDEWNRRLFEATATELELLERAKEEAIAKAEELGAETTSIVEYYALKRQEILDRQLREDEERDRKRLQSVTDFEEAWTRKLFEQSASRLERLQRDRDEAIRQAEELGADTTAILEYYAEEERRIRAELEAEREAARERELAAERELQAKREQQLQQWEERLFRQTASEIEILEAARDKELQLAEELGIDKTAILEYYENERQKILKRQREVEEKAAEEVARKELEALEARERARISFEEEWNKKLFQTTADRLEILEREKEEALAKAEELGADKTAILEYYTAQQQRILNEQARATQEAAEREAQALAAFEEAWARKLFEQSATRLELLQRDREEAIRQAEAIGADTAAILEYYAEEEKRILAEIEAEREAARERELKAEQDAQRERERLLRQWETRLFEQTASELELLEARMQEELKLAEEHGLDTLAILQYYENEQQKILSRRRAAEEKAAEEAAKREAEALEARERARLEFEERWARRLFELRADELEQLAREKEEAVRQAEEVGADTTAILEYYAEQELRIKQRRAEEAQKIAEAEAEAERKRIEELERARLEFEQSWEDRLFKLTASREELLLREREEALARAAELGADVNKILEYYARRQIELAEEIAEEQRSLWEKAFDAVKSPLERFVEAVSNAAEGLAGVVKAIKAGNWREAFLTILMETESFAKAMELLGAVLQPVIALFDAVLAPIINFLLKLWNGIIDALSKISIFGWKPFGGLADKKIKLVGEDDGGSDTGRGGGRQVSEITGPTRDLLTDLLSPLAHLGQIVAPIQDIRQILYERLPNFNTLDFAGAGVGVGAMGPTVIIENLNVTAPTTGVDDISQATIDQIERALAGRIQFGIRGRGGR